jgi:citrate lyase beta subunit
MGIVCIDLEDAVAPHHKAQARKDTVVMFAETPSFGRSEVLVRINPLRTRDGLADVLAVMGAKALPTGLMLPKVKTPEGCCHVWTYMDPA